MRDHRCTFITSKSDLLTGDEVVVAKVPAANEV